MTPVKNQVWRQTMIPIRSEVSNQVLYNVWNQVWNYVSCNLPYNAGILIEVKNRVKDELRNIYE